MAGALYLTMLDASNGLWQIRVDEEISKLFTFSSPCDRFRFLFIPYGIHSASEVCQARIAAIIESIEGCRNAQDEIITRADTPELLEKRTNEILQAVRRSGLKQNRAKCQFVVEPTNDLSLNDDSQRQWRKQRRGNKYNKDDNLLSCLQARV